MSSRLRNQAVTARPRVIASEGLYKVEWLGHYSGEPCAVSKVQFSEAVEFANSLVWLYNSEAHQ